MDDIKVGNNTKGKGASGPGLETTDILVCEFKRLRFLGDYYSGHPGELDQDPDEEWVRNLEEEGRAYQEWDEDADVDESGNVWLSIWTAPIA